MPSVEAGKPDELALRKELLALDDGDAARLAELAQRVPIKDIVMECFAKDMMKHAVPAQHMRRLDQEGRREGVMARVVDAFGGIVRGVVDEAYLEHRRSIGRVHASIGLEPKWYVAALARVQSRVAAHLRTSADGEREPWRAFDALASLGKMIFFDLTAVLEAYHENATRESHLTGEGITELAAPVIEVWDQILILPLVGTMDTRRSQEVTEALLTAVVEKKARSVIIDLTGLPIMDTATANHLFKTVSAVELLGASAIVTGVRPAIAQTVISLGIETNRLNTKTRLADGLRAALKLAGKQVVDVPVAARGGR